MISYEEQAAAGLAAYGEDPKALLLAIESSCDETAAAVLQGGRRVLSMAVHTQIPLHRQYGGVVPELASRSHVERIGPVVEEALRRAEVSLSEIDALAVTCGPGLVGALLVGVSYAKGLALALGLPLVGVNHLAGHIAANYLTFPKLRPPFTCLVASGGHSHIVAVEDYESFRLLGRRRTTPRARPSTRPRACWACPIPAGRSWKNWPWRGMLTPIPCGRASMKAPGWI